MIPSNTRFNATHPQENRYNRHYMSFLLDSVSFTPMPNHNQNAKFELVRQWLAKNKLCAHKGAMTYIFFHIGKKKGEKDNQSSDRFQILINDFFRHTLKKSMPLSGVNLSITMNLKRCFRKTVK